MSHGRRPESVSQAEWSSVAVSHCLRVKVSLCFTVTVLMFSGIMIDVVIQYCFYGVSSSQLWSVTR